MFPRSMDFVVVAVIVILSYINVHVITAQQSSPALSPTTTELNHNYDRFNYIETKQDSIHVDYGPPDWEFIQCPDLLTCVRI